MGFDFTPEGRQSIFACIITYNQEAVFIKLKRRGQLAKALSVPLCGRTTTQRGRCCGISFVCGTVTYLGCLSFGLQSLGGPFLVKHLLEMFVFNGLRLDTFTVDLQLNAFSAGRVINTPGIQTAVES